MLAAQRQIDAGHSKLEGSTAKVGQSLTQTFGITGPAVLAAAGAAVGKFAFDSIRAASDLGESLNKTNVVFGHSADAVRTFGEQSAESFGISNQAALEAAAGFGNILQTSGIVEQKSADMSVALVKLAGDLASFNNIEPAEALEKLRSGLVGEAEPLRTVGVLLSETRVATEAYRSGIAKTGEELTDAQKVQARYNIILQDTKKQQGDFGRTLAESLPNQMRVAKAELIDFEAAIGSALLPSLTSLISTGTELAQDVAPAIQFAFEVAGAGAQTFAENLEAIIAPMQWILDHVPGMGASAENTGFSFLNLAKAAQGLLNPLDKIAHPTHIVPWIAWKNALDTARGATEDATAATGDLSIGLHGAAGAMAKFREPLAAVSGGLQRFAGMSHDAFKSFKEDALSSIRDVGTGLANWSTALDLTGAKTKKNMQGMADDARQMAKDYKDLDRTAVPDKFKAFLITEGPEAVHGFVTANKGAQQDIIQAWKGMQDSLQSAVQTMKRIASSGGHEVGSNLSRGILGGIASQSESVRAAAAKVITDAIAAAKAAGKISSPSKVMEEMGIDLVRGLLDGLESRENDVQRAFEHITSAQSGFHGQISRPSPFLAHPGPPRGGDGGSIGGITVNVYVAGSVTTERDLVEATRQGLDRVGRYNPNIFGGRA